MSKAERIFQLAQEVAAAYDLLNGRLAAIEKELDAAFQDKKAGLEQEKQELEALPRHEGAARPLPAAPRHIRQLREL